MRWSTDGAVQVLAVNTLGVLYIVETGDSVQSVADLKGKTIYASGKGATPEYALSLTMPIAVGPLSAPIRMDVFSAGETGGSEEAAGAFWPQEAARSSAIWLHIYAFLYQNADDISEF